MYAAAGCGFQRPRVGAQKGTQKVGGGAAPPATATAWYPGWFASGCSATARTPTMGMLHKMFGSVAHLDRCLSQFKLKFHENGNPYKRKSYKSTNYNMIEPS